MGRGVRIFIGIAAVMLCMMTGCGKQKESESEENMNSYEQISQEEAKALMDSEKDYVILDVRTEDEYSEGHIRGAVCLPNETIGDTEPEALTDKSQLILVYCRSGSRSKQAAEKLADLGYSSVKEFGGINTWPYETE